MTLTFNPSSDTTLYAQWKVIETETEPTPEPTPVPAKETGKVTKTEKKQGKIDINSKFRVVQVEKKVEVEWGEVEGAEKYVVYATYCGDKYQKIKTITDRSLIYSFKKLAGEKLDLTKNVKVYVAAYRTVNGQDVLIAKTIKAHIVGTKSTKYTNAERISLAKTKYSVKTGNTFTIKAETILVDPSKKMLSDDHALEFRYLSTDKSVATVDKKGVVTGKSKGTCYIWVYSKNGLGVKVKVTVK